MSALEASPSQPQKDVDELQRWRIMRLLNSVLKLRCIDRPHLVGPCRRVHREDKVPPELEHGLDELCELVLFIVDESYHSETQLVTEVAQPID